MSDTPSAGLLARLAVAGLLPLLAPPAGAAAGEPELQSLLQAADAPRHVLREGVMRVVATVDHEGQSTRTTLDVYVHEPDQALCVFRDGDLARRMILIAAERVWLFMPGTTHPIRISPNQRLFGGASISDVARLRFADEFSAASLGPDEAVDGVPCRSVTLAGRTRRAAYGSGTLWLGKADGLPRRALLALRSGKPAKDLRFAEYASENGRTVLRRVEIRHLLPSERGMVTTLEFLSYESRLLPPGLFDPDQVRHVPLEQASAEPR